MICILCILQKRSAQMKGIRASTNKRPHSGGARPFAARAEEYAQKGEQAPHAKTYIACTRNSILRALQVSYLLIFSLILQD